MDNDAKKAESQESRAERFERQAEQPQQGIVAEFVDFLRHNKRWWLAPIIIAMLILGVLVVLSGTPLAPWIYTL